MLNKAFGGVYISGANKFEEGHAEMGMKLRWAPAVVVSVLFAAFTSAVPAAAQSPAPPLPRAGQSASSSNDVGISALRHQVLRGHSTQSMPAARTPLLTCQVGWRVVDNQNGSWNNALGGIAAVTPVDMWAVGNSQSPTPSQFGNGDQNLAEHWNGSYWSIVPTPNPGPDADDLNDVAAIANNDVWAVGRENTTNAWFSEALHWNGTAWIASTMPTTPGGGQNQLNDVVAFATNDVWAVGTFVGDNGTGTFVQRTLVEHYDGTSWTVIPTPNASTADNVLYGVGGTSGSNLFAVGYARGINAGVRNDLILRTTNNGGAWTFTTVGSGQDTVLTSVAAQSTSDAMAVGLQGNGNNTTEAQHFTGTTWSAVGTTGLPNLYNDLGDIAAGPFSAYGAVGFSSLNNTAAAQPLIANWNGTSWSYSTAVATGSGDTALFSMAVPPATTNDIWAVGLDVSSQGLTQNLIENDSDLAAPANVSATSGSDQSSVVSWAAPCSGSGITSYVVTAYDGCTIQGQISAASSPATFSGLTNGTRYTFKVAAVNNYGLGAQSVASPVAVPSGATTQTAYTACSSQQYTLAGSDGATWKDIDTTNLQLTFTPSVLGAAILTGNVDLWTENSGYNQDVGIAVSGGGGGGTTYPTAAGQPEAWKESGGSAGTFSPNAAFVQTGINVMAGQTYTVKLQWKTNHSDPGTIAAAAGPLGSGFSPTRLTVQVIPASANPTAFAKVSTSQYLLSNNDGSTWKTMDATNLSLPFTPPAGNWTALVMGNVDLWTENAGYNQDIGIALSGGAFPTTSGQPETWKESGGSAGTFSPNAAFVEGAFPVIAGTAYTASLTWKASHSASGATIAAGAGPIGGKFSPTSLIILLIPSPAAVASSKAQYSQVNSDGLYWQALDSTNLMTTISPASNTSYVVSGNADLWTANAGYNQDIGIMVSGGAYGPNGTLVAWKESGGLAGTFSPNAAFVTTDLHLQPGTYKIWLVWKANQLAKAQNAIYVGAGPINANYSPTWLSVMQVSQP